MNQPIVRTISEIPAGTHHLESTTDPVSMGRVESLSAPDPHDRWVWLGDWPGEDFRLHVNPGAGSSAPTPTPYAYRPIGDWESISTTPAVEGTLYEIKLGAERVGYLGRADDGGQDTSFPPMHWWLQGTKQLPQGRCSFTKTQSADPGTYNYLAQAHYEPPER